MTYSIWAEPGSAHGVAQKAKILMIHPVLRTSLLTSDQGHPGSCFSFREVITQSYCWSQSWGRIAAPPDFALWATVRGSPLPMCQKEGAVLLYWGEK